MLHSLGQHVMPGNCFRATAPQHRWGPSLRMRHRRDRGGAIPPARSRVTIGDANRLDRAQVGRGPLGAKHRPERIIAHGPINFMWAPAATAAAGHGFSYAVNSSFPHRNLKFNLDLHKLRTLLNSMLLFSARLRQAELDETRQCETRSCVGHGKPIENVRKREPYFRP